MRNILAVYDREIKSYFVSPVFYILATVFLLTVGNNFKDTFFSFATQTINELMRATNYGIEVSLINVNNVASTMFSFMDYIFILITPLLTMRLYAEEKKNGTMELLMTSPITTSQVLFGKFFSCLTIYSIMMLLTVAFNIFMMVHSGYKLDLAPVLSSYLGTFLLGATLISIGMFFSSLTENQIVAAALTLTFIMGLWLLVYTSRFIAEPFNLLLRYISLADHLDSFTLGYIGIKHIVYYLSMTTFWLFLTGISIESARWRQ
ncbi:ABC transporter permease [Candidatus Latescibacterota bacterium]